MLRVASAAAALAAITFAWVAPVHAQDGKRFEEVARFDVPEARQGRRWDLAHTS